MPSKADGGRCNRDIRLPRLIVPWRKRWRKKISAQPKEREKEGHPVWRYIGDIIKMEAYGVEATERSVTIALRDRENPIFSSSLPKEGGLRFFLQIRRGISRDGKKVETPITVRRACRRATMTGRVPAVPSMERTCRRWSRVAHMGDGNDTAKMAKTAGPNTRDWEIQ